MKRTELRATSRTERRAFPKSESRLRTDGGGGRTPMRPAAPWPLREPRAMLTVLSGLEAGRVVALDGDETILGCDPDAQIWVSDPAVSWRHARVVRGRDGAIFLDDLGSTNGTFVDGRRVEGRQRLEPGQSVQLGPSFRVRFALGDNYEESFLRALYDSSVRDGLTGAFNRRYFDQRLAAEITYAHRRQGSLAVMMIDVDHFKQFNDALGHRAGDELLCTLARELGRVLGTTGVLARWGGDEFAVMARSAAGEDSGRLAERLRAAARVASAGAPGTRLQSTISIGVAVLKELQSDEGPAELVVRADKRLYAAKLAGRDRVCRHDPE